MLQRWLKEIHWPLVFSVFGLILIGTLFVTSAAYHDSGNYLSKQFFWVLAAGVVFLAAMTFRTIDYEACTWAMRGSRGIGTHFVWHTLNAVVVYVLLLAAIRYGASAQRSGSRVTVWLSLHSWI